MSNDELIQWIYARIGAERDSGIIKPVIIATANLAFRDLAQFLIDNDSELAKKLKTTLLNETWADSKYAAPSDMFFHRQREFTRIDLGLGRVPVHQVEDRKKLDLMTGLSNHYFALDGRYFYIKHSAGTTSGNNLNIEYNKIPTIDDIDDDLRNIFLDLLITRLVPKPPTELDDSNK